MDLYEYQKRVARRLRERKSVVLQAPTGSGKTLAALWPFFEAWDRNQPSAFPRQCLYVVPMRVLANQFLSETRWLIRERLLLAEVPRVTIQTGEHPHDPYLMGDLAFATLDQVLSSALGVPYSLPISKANVNVGAVLGSYLVFDEFHLFPPQARRATLHLLSLFGRIAPFLLMTATFSRPMLEEVAEFLGAVPELVPEGEVEWIESRGGKWPRRERRFHVRGEVLSADAVLAAHDRRTLAVCNTVDRAMELYRGLVKQGCRPVPVDHPGLEPIYERLRQADTPEEHQGVLEEGVAWLRERMADAPEGTSWVMLLHSRFERPHRQLKEAFLRAECGPREEDSRGWEISRLLVVGTQVVEVGLDVTSQALHTELAPAASVIQRAGRCARYPGERGEVFVYQVPEEDGRPRYVPYEETEVCERTWEALQERDGEILRFTDEQAVVDFAHGEADRRLLREMREDAGRTWMLITDALTLGETGVRPELIRSVDSRTLIVYDAPDGTTEESPFRYEGFSLWHGTLRGAVKGLLKRAEEVGLPWALRCPIPVREEEESRTPMAYRWVDVVSPEDVSSALLFAVHPRLVAYDAAQGFRLGAESDGRYRSPEVRRRRKGEETYTYALESYAEHVAKMRRVFERRFRDRLAWVEAQLARLEGTWHLPPGLLEQATRLVLALHDVGKLQVEWQEWAANYQKRVSGVEPPFLVAHTWSETEEHRRIAREVHPKRPNHAGEGALASARILWEALEGKHHRPLYLAAVTAIARHHSPFLDEASPYRLHPQAEGAVAEALEAVGGADWRAWVQWLLRENRVPNLKKRLLPMPSDEASWKAWVLYFVMVRVLRLSDMLSQE
ncbi:MAG TPA: DEAD/DEAH box helicase [Thermoflexia bacterium]|nr:DEAD/DEAH box helicase [Thermoflexia bacterium]